MRTVFNGLVAASILAVASGNALADESGVAFWMSGQYASLAAVPPSPGWSLVSTAYYYSGSADKTTTFQHGNTLSTGIKSDSPLLLLELGYATESKFLGGQPYIGLAWGPGSNYTSVNASLSQPALSGSRSDTVFGGTDLYPIASLAWNNANHNWMSYITGNIPVGTYDPNSLSNLGIGHAAIDAGGGYTYLNAKSGLEFSAVLGFTYNAENSDTNYKNGIDSHLDWGVSQFLSANWQVGLVGYVYYQLTNDSGSGDRVGAFKSQVAAIGPEIGYAFSFNKQAAYFNLRGYKEFNAQNRVEGYALYAQLSLPLGGPGK